MHNPQPVTPLSVNPIETEELVVSEQSPETTASVWVSRFTGIVGAITMAIALFVWWARPGHYRLVLLFLTIAMFMAILHAYTFETGRGD